ncbi:hypothetical protein ABTL69_19360, partial [Acinetobacter baumannii]
EPLALYHSAAQIIHGNLSPFSFLDNHADTAINQIRMAIEMRFRRGFGVIAKLDTSKNHEIWPACGIEDHAGALMPDFRPFLPA